MSRRLHAWACAALAAFAGMDAGAASLQVAPTTLTLPADKAADGLWLSNSGAAPVKVQLRLFRWTQADGRDVLEATRDLVVSPPMQTLAPGQRQLVRLVRTGAAPPAQAAYRVIVDELPDTDPAREGLQFVLRYSIPIFLDPAGVAPASHALSVRLDADADGDATLVAENRGGHYAQVADLSWLAGDGSTRTVLPGLVGYVLPGQRMRWSLKSPPAAFADGRFRARINGAVDEETLPLSPPPR